MHAAEATRARGSAARIARDVGAIVVLAVERVALHVEERRQAPTAAPARARYLRSNATWTAAAVGAVASVAPGPLLGVAAAALESALLAEIESRATARLLAMVAGDHSGSVTAGWSEARRTMFRAGAQKAAMLIAERAARAGARIALKELGVALPRLGVRAVLGPAAPVVGAAWSAAWNALEMHRRLTPAVRAVEDAFGDPLQSLRGSSHGDRARRHRERMDASRTSRRLTSYRDVRGRGRGEGNGIRERTVGRCREMRVRPIVPSDGEACYERACRSGAARHDRGFHDLVTGTPLDRA